MDLLSFAIIAFIVLAVSKTWKRILRWWHRKKFCESNRGLCRALVAAGFPDFKEYLYFKEDFLIAISINGGMSTVVLIFMEANCRIRKKKKS